MGEDWKGKFDDFKQYCDVIYLPRTENISTTELKKTIKSLIDLNMNDLQNTIFILQQIIKELS